MGPARLAGAVLTATALAVGLAACGSGAKPSSMVDHAVVVRKATANRKVDVWRDAATGDLALRVQGFPPMLNLQARELITVPDGPVDRFPTSDAAWAYLGRVYGVTQASVEAALKHAHSVHRPAGMLAMPPKQVSVTVDHFASLDDLRKQVDFQVRDPGRRLNGLTQVDLQIRRSSRDPTHPFVDLWYSHPTSTAGQEAVVEVVSVGSPEGRSIAAGLKTDVGPRIRGPHFVANSGDDHYAFKCGDAYVDVGMYVRTIERWRAILTQVARDCPG